MKISMKQLPLVLVLLASSLNACSQKTSNASTEMPEQAAEQALEELSRMKDITVKGGESISFRIASIKKTPCFGRCPVYEATLYSDNRLVYEGKQYTEREGTFEAKISNEQLKELLKFALAADFFKLSEMYPMEGRPIPDLPSTITYLKIGERENQVNNNHDAPQALRAYEKVFIKLFEELDWKEVEGK